MANTRQSTKRAKQAKKKNIRNTTIRSATKSAFKAAVDAVKAAQPNSAQSLTDAKAQFANAIRTLAKAASKGSIPKARAARKTARLTKFIQKNSPQVLK